MHPIHPIIVHFPIALLCATVAFDVLARRWPTGPESVLELHESLGTVTLVVLAVLLGLRLALQRGWLKDIPSLTLGLGAIGIVMLALTGYWGGELVYTSGIGVKAVMSPVTP